MSNVERGRVEIDHVDHTTVSFANALETSMNSARRATPFSVPSRVSSPITSQSMKTLLLRRNSEMQLSHGLKLATDDTTPAHTRLLPSPWAIRVLIYSKVHPRRVKRLHDPYRTNTHLSHKTAIALFETVCSLGRDNCVMLK